MNKAELWDNGCKNDNNRNCFVIPKLSDWLNKNPVQRIAYLGSGTGYIIRSLAENFPSASFTLVDKDEDRIGYSKLQMPSSVNANHFCADVLELPPEIGTFDVVILCNLLLEVEGDGALISVLKALLRDEGHICVFVPDTLVDFIKSSPNDDDVEKFTTSTVRLEKKDKFTGDEYPFLAQRLINLIARFYEQGFNLEQVERSNNVDGYYFLVLKNSDNAIETR